MIINQEPWSAEVFNILYSAWKFVLTKTRYEPKRPKTSQNKPKPAETT